MIDTKVEVAPCGAQFLTDPKTGRVWLACQQCRTMLGFGGEYPASQALLIRSRICNRPKIIDRAKNASSPR